MNEVIEILLHTDDAIKEIVARNIFEAYIVLFLVIFAETGFIFFPFLPGDGLLFSAGVIAASTELSIIFLVPVLIIAAITGNITNYSVGRFFGKGLERSKNRFIQNHLMKYLIQTRYFYDKHGEKSIIIGRFFPVIRTYIPFFAGLSGFTFKNFSFSTIAGAMLWVPLFSLTGYFLGTIPWVKENYLVIFGGLIIMTLIPLVYNALKLAFSKR